MQPGKLKHNTAAALAEIERAAARGYDKIAPVTLTCAYGRAAVAAAFRIAKARGIVEVAYVSAAGTPVYRPAGMGAMLAEAKKAVLQ